MTAPSTQVTTLLTAFGLTTAPEELVPRLTQAGHHAALPVLLEVFAAEADARRQRRVTRLRRASRLPPGKTFATLDTGRLPGPVVQQLETLAAGVFLETATNVLAFGLPGVGKSHALCAVGHALVEAGHSVLCAPACALVQELLGAKRDLDLPRALRKLDLFEVILLDDPGYVQQSPDEGVSTRFARPPLRSGPSGDTPSVPPLRQQLWARSETFYTASAEVSPYALVTADVRSTASATVATPAVAARALMSRIFGWSVWLYGRFLFGRGSFRALERWQTAYLPGVLRLGRRRRDRLPPLFRYA